MTLHNKLPLYKLAIHFRPNIGYGRNAFELRGKAYRGQKIMQNLYKYTFVLSIVKVLVLS